MGNTQLPVISPPIPYSNEVLRMMVETAPVAIVVIDPAGGIVLVNSKLTEMFGYTADDLAQKPLELLMPERYRTGHVDYRSEFRENPRLRYMGSGLDLAGRRNDGSEFPIEVGLSYFRSGDDLLMMASVADITRRKQNEEMLERRVQERTRELERRRQVSDSLRDILAILNSNRPLPEILQHIVVQASQLLKADASAIYQIQDGDASIVIEASSGLSAQQLVEAYHPRLTAAVSRAVNGSQPVTLTAQEDLPGPPPQQDYCAQLAVPLQIKDEIFGGLMLYYVDPRKFSAEEIELAVMFGDQAVLAIENARLRSQAERTAIAAERNRIARDLHDSVTQTLFSATLIAEVLPKLSQRDSEEGARRLEELRQLTRGALAEMRTLLLELRPATLTEVSIEELLRQLTEATRGRTRIPIDVQIDVTSPLAPDVKVAFYYVAQEALNNVAKHARARRVQVALHSHPEGAELSVRDDGQGFDITQVTPEHLGLAIMRERTESIDGVLAIASGPGQGTSVTLRWPTQEGTNRP